MVHERFFESGLILSICSSEGMGLIGSLTPLLRGHLLADGFSVEELTHGIWTIHASLNHLEGAPVSRFSRL